MHSSWASLSSFFLISSAAAAGCVGGEAPDPPTSAGQSGAGGAGGTSAGSGNAGKGGRGGTSAGGRGGSAAGGTGGAARGGTGGSGSATCSTNAATLKDAAACQNRPIGVALGQSHLGEAQYATAAREYNYVTPENEMKWDALQPTEGQFSYARADQIVSFAQQNGMSVKGHTLVWYSQLPQWVTSLGSADRVRQVMGNHIASVMNHYKGKVAVWDVVNEAWNDDGGSLRNNVFMQRLGEGYIDEAFEAARAADPDAKLYYNDYGTEGMSPKANAVYEMVRGLKERGVPIDGVGMQMHTRLGNGAPTVSEFVSNMQRLAALGLEVAISEMDVVACGSNPLAERLETQAGRYKALIEACLNEPACKAITIWGTTDRYSWLNNVGTGTTGCMSGEAPRGLLLDDSYQKKPAYTAVMDALLGR